VLPAADTSSTYVGPERQTKHGAEACRGRGGPGDAAGVLAKLFRAHGHADLGEDGGGHGCRLTPSRLLMRRTGYGQTTVRPS
jgi:hypothetical protein